MPSRDSAARRCASTTCSSYGSRGATSTTAHAHQHHGTISPGQEKASTASRTSGRGPGCARGGMRRLRARKWRTSRVCVHGLSALRRAPRYREASRISMIVRRIRHFGCRLRCRMWGRMGRKLGDLLSYASFRGDPNRALVTRSRSCASGKPAMCTDCGHCFVTFLADYAT